MNGQDHLETAEIQGSIAVILAKQGLYTKALELWKKELAVKENMLGPEHPSVAATRCHIRLAYQGWIGRNRHFEEL